MTQPSQPQPEHNNPHPRPYPLLVAEFVGEARDRQLAAARQYTADRLMHNAGDPAPTQPDYSTINTGYLKEQLKLQRGSDDEIPDDDPELQELQRRYNEFTIDKIHPDNWYVGAVQNPNALIPAFGPSGIEQFNAMMQANYDLSREGESQEDSPSQNPELERLGEKVDELRRKCNLIVAELMALPIYRRKKKQELEEKYHEASMQLSEVVATLLNEEVTAKRAEGADNAAVIDFLENYANQLQLSDRDSRRQLMLEEGGRLIQFMERYANAGKMTKITVGLGAAAMVAATVATAGVAVAGAGLGVAAGSTVVGAVGAVSRFGKTYALRVSSIFQDSNEILKIDRQALERPSQDEGKINQVLGYMNWETEQELTSAEKKKKSAVRWAIGIAATGSTVALAAEHTDVLDRFSNLFRGEGFKPDTRPEVPDDTASDTQNDTKKNDSHKGAEDSARSRLDVSEVSRKAFTIREGEGWFQTLKELHVNPGDFDRLLETAGPDLVKAGFAYEDPSIGGYGMLMSEDGKLSKEAIQILAEHAQQEGISMDAHFTEVASPSKPDLQSQELVKAFDDVDPSSAEQVEEFNERLQHAGYTLDEHFTPDSIAGGKGFDGDAAIYAKALDSLGVAQDEWVKVMKEVAPQLQKLGFAEYTDGAWQIKTTSGYIPREAMRVLARYVDKNNLGLAS